MAWSVASGRRGVGGEGGGTQHSTQGSATDFCGQVGPGIGQLACGQPLYPQRCVGRASPATVLTPSPTYSASTAGRRVHGCPPADPARRDPVLRVPPYTPDYLPPPPPRALRAPSHEIRRVVLTVIDRGASSVLDLYIYVSFTESARIFVFFTCFMSHWLEQISLVNNYMYLQDAFFIYCIYIYIYNLLFLISLLIS